MRITILLFTLLVISFSSKSQSWKEIGKSLHFRKVIDVSLSGDGKIMAIGQASAQSPGGQINIYQRDQNRWVKLGDSILGQGARDYAGFSVALSNDGKTVVFGAPYDYANNDYGEVRVFTYDGNTWEQRGSDISGNNKDDQMGMRVAINGNGNIIAMAGVSDGLGKVKVYKWNGAEWSQVGSEFVGKKGWGENSPLLGSSIALDESGETIIIGERQKDVGDDGWKHGQVHVYELIDGDWKAKGSIFKGAFGEGQLGNSVAINAGGNIIAMSEPGNSSIHQYTGAVHVYEWKSSKWEKLGESLSDTLKAVSIGDGSNGKGIALSDNGKVLVIGKRFYPHSGLSAVGMVESYHWNAGKWEKFGQKHYGNTYTDYYGEGLSISDDGLTIAVTSRSDTTRTKGYEARTFSIDKPININPVLNHSLMIYPNPTTGRFFLDTPDGQIGTVSLFNLQGQLIHYIDRASGEGIALSCKKGVYLLQLKTNSFTKFQKLIVQ